MKIPGLSPKNKQACLILTEDGRIVDEDLEVLKGCAANHESMEAWVLDSDNQVKNYETGVLTQIVTERSFAPLVLNGQGSNIEATREVVDSIECETFDQELAKIEKRATKNKLASKLLLMALVLVIGVVFMGAVAMFQSGKIEMPF